MEKNRELVKNTAILTFGRTCTQFVSFFLLPLYTALLSPEEYGIVDLFSTYVILLVPVTSWQLDQGLFRFILDVRDDKKKISELYSQVLAINIIQLIAVFLIYFIFGRWISSDYKIYVVFGIVFNVFSSILMQFARGLGKMVHYSVSSFLTAVSTIACNILLIVGLHMQAKGMILATLIGYCASILYLVIVLKVWHYVKIPNLKGKQVKELLRYSIPLVPNQISGWVMSASDRVIINFFLGTAINGIYSISNKFTNIIATFYGFFNMAWVESLSVHINDSDWGEYINKTIKDVFNLFFCICLIILSILPLIFPLLIDSSYSESYLQIPILIVAVIIQVYVGLLSAIYIALKKSGTIAKTTVVAAIMNVVVHLILISFFDLYAASISTMAANLFLAGYRTYDLRKIIRVELDKQQLLSFSCVLIITMVIYYFDIALISSIWSMIILFFSYMINKKIIRGFYDSLINKMRGGNHA